MERVHFEDEHHMFREAFQTFVQREMAPNRERWEESGIVDRELFAAAGAAGFLAMPVPEQYGGAGVEDFRYNQIIAEELARGDVYASGLGLTLHNDVCLPYFMEYTNDEQKERCVLSQHDDPQSDERKNDAARPKTALRMGRTPKRGH